MYTTEVWDVVKTWRKICHKLDRYLRNITFLNECIQNNLVPHGFRMDSNVTYMDKELLNICNEINIDASNSVINEVVNWLDVEIRKIVVDEADVRDKLKQIASVEDFQSISETVTRERQRVNGSENDKQQKKLDRLLTEHNARHGILEETPVRTRSNTSRRSTFVRRRNRRVNRKSSIRRKRNWIKNANLELLNLLRDADNIQLPEDMYDAINLTDTNLDENESNVCRLGLKFVPSIRKYDRVKKWLDIQEFKRKIRLQYYFSINEESDDEQVENGNADLLHVKEPWKPKSRSNPPPTENVPLETFLSNMEKELLDPRKEKKVKDNLSREERQAMYKLSKMNKDKSCDKMIRVQDKGARIVIESKDRYITEMNKYLSNEEVFRKDNVDQSYTYAASVRNWATKWEESLTKDEIEWIVPKEVKPGKVYGNIKTHKKDNPYRYIVSARGTAIENLARWIEFHLKELSGQHKAYLKDTKDFLKYLETMNAASGPFPKDKLWLVSRDIVNYYPSCSTDMCIKAVGELLDTRDSNIPPKNCILDALKITMSSNNCQFLNEYFTQIDGATIGGPESASVTDIYGAVFIDKVIENNIINENEDWKRYRDDSFSISTDTSKERENDKTTWMNNNIVKGKIKFTMEASQEEMIFLDTKVTPVEVSEGNVLLATDMYSKKTDTHQYVSPKSCHPKQQIEGIPIGVADRIRRNCSDNIADDRNFKNRLVEYKAYLLKSGHDSRSIDNAFLKRASTKREDLLNKEKDRIETSSKKFFVTDYEPSFPSVYTVWRKNEHLLKNDPNLRKAFPNGVSDFKVTFRRGGKNIKEWIASPTLNTFDSSIEEVNTPQCTDCGKNCVDCGYLKDKGRSFRSNSLNRKFLLRQKVNCLSENVIYLVTCLKCGMQGVGETTDFKKRMANYRSCIRNGRISCNVDRHFVETAEHSLDDFDVQIICMLEKPPRGRRDLRIRLKQFEGYWQIKLCTLKPYGMNSINELEANLKWSDKQIFFPEQDH